MCSECQKMFCPAACPNSEAPQVSCDICCAEADYEGAEGEKCCVECISEMSLDELLRFCGYRSSLEVVMLMAGISKNVKKLNSKDWRDLARR